MVCQLSEGAIKNFMSNSEGAVSNMFRDQISKLNYIVRQLESDWNLKSGMLNERVSSLRGYAARVLKEAQSKHTSALYHLENTPSTISVPETRYKTVTNSDGSTSKQAYTVYVEKPNPEYERAKEIERIARGLLSDAKNLQNAPEEIDRRIKSLNGTVNEFKTAAENVVRAFGDIEELAKRAVRDINKEAKDALRYIRDAKRPAGPLPEIRGDGGSVDVDGVKSYIRSTQDAYRDCEAAFGNLCRKTVDLNYGWNDEVYDRFSDRIGTDLDANITKFDNALSSLNMGLNEMCEALERYARTQPSYNGGYVHFSYQAVSVNGYSISGSASFDIRV